MLLFDTNVFIAHASNDYGMSGMLQALRQLESYAASLVAREVRQTVQDYRQSSLDDRSNAERCLTAFRRLQNLSDRDWDAIEPKLVDEIAVLHDLCVSDEDLQ